jgi:hypothetical protein
VGRESEGEGMEAIRSDSHVRSIDPCALQHGEAAASHGFCASCRSFVSLQYWAVATVCVDPIKI